MLFSTTALREHVRLHERDALGGDQLCGHVLNMVSFDSSAQEVTEFLKRQGIDLERKGQRLFKMLEWAHGDDDY